MTAAVAPYLTVFGWSFLAATVLPLGSEPALFALVRRGHSATMMVAVATLGNYLGACTTYWLARKAASLAGRADLDHTRAGRLAQRLGAPVLLLSWVPILGDALVAAAGVLRVRLLPFTLWTVVGKGLRYALVAWGAWSYQ
jgi:membrane protein YqaA with SNARE-associated domain